MKQIQIIAVEEKQTKEGKPYLRVQTDKGWMSVFDSELFPAIQEGSEIQAVIEQRGDFQTIIKAEKSKQAHTEDRIFKGQCFNNAALIIAQTAANKTHEQIAKEVFDLAEALEKEGKKRQ